MTSTSGKRHYAKVNYLNLAVNYFSFFHTTAMLMASQKKKIGQFFCGALPTSTHNKLTNTILMGKWPR